MKIACLNNISPIGLATLPTHYQVVPNVVDADAILVRSQNMLDMTLPPSILAIARAGAGVNNIPLEKCADLGIVVFNTPGANANGVKELVIAGMLLASRD
ncbi:MAG: 3-phosphoglycerate dehydrogenase, partial [Candidatus Izemoplasmatales bacterium]